jgi:DNA-binding response OmpR family regulator
MRRSWSGRLRKAINVCNRTDTIRTVRGAGYAFNEKFGEA